MSPAVEAAPGGGAAPAGGGGGFFNGAVGTMMGAVGRMMLIYGVTQYMFKRGGYNDYNDGGPKSPASQRKIPSLDPIYSKGELVDMWVYITETPRLGRFEDPDGTRLVWQESGMVLGTDERSKTLEITPSKHITENNGTLYVHSFFTRSGLSPDPRADSYREDSTFGRTDTLVSFWKPRKKSVAKNLLGGVEEGGDSALAEGGGGGEAEAVAVQEEEEDDDVDPLWEAWWKPNMTMNLVDDYTSYKNRMVPPQVLPHLHELRTPSGGKYFPVVFFNDFWLLRDKYIRINDTVTTLPLTMTVAPINLFKWQMTMQMEESFRMQKGMGTMQEGESDELKRVLLEGNPYFLVLTGVVSVFHTLFDMLAFKNDIGFWKKQKSMKGLSIRSIGVNAFCQVVIFLYLCDNDTSWLILFSSILGLIIEFWKITKAMHVSLDFSNGYPALRFQDRSSYTESDTQKWDREAMLYMSYAMYPLVFCYACYSLYYNKHKGWYSFILSTLVGCVYAFGFVMMCPQLYINYKMKSVAHLPWRQMTYKFLNTIMDDLFAFVIKMPTMHRISVFRDDLIFLIYIYQRYKYPVDAKRVNEYGFSAEEGPKEGEEGAQPALEGAEGMESIGEGEAKKDK